MKIWLENKQDWFVLPVYRSQLIYWLTCKYPGPKDKAKFNKMRCDQLRKVIIEVCKRTKGGENGDLSG